MEVEVARSVNGATVSGPIGSAEQRFARRLGLHWVAPDALTIRRVRRGRGFAFMDAEGHPIRARRLIRRLTGLAVPPAYNDVLYAQDGSAHLQAIGRDAAGRLQYRYHPEWEKIRERRKARRMLRLIETLPRIRRAVTQHLSGAQGSRDYALAAAIELVAMTSIRAGGEEYARQRGTRGAATLLKSNVAVKRGTILLSFRGKGGKPIAKELHAPRLARAIANLRKLPGRRLFQFCDQAGEVRQIRARDINEFLRTIAGGRISLKDFRTLCASGQVLERLARTVPARTERQRKRQVLDAVREAADDLVNTPAICRKSYVHQTVLDAFETGALAKYSAGPARNGTRRERLVARVLTAHVH